MAKYSLELYNIDTVNGGYERTAEIFSVDDLSYTKVLNDAGSMSFSLNVFNPAANPDLFLPGRTNIHVKRNGGSTGWFGPLEDIDVEFESNSGKVTFTAKTYEQHLKYRLTEGTVVYSQRDASIIAASLIQTVQARTNGQLNITTGTLPTVGTTSDTLEYQEILDALRNQSNNVVGYDFDMTPTFDSNNLVSGVQFNMYKGKGILLNNLPPVTLKRLEWFSGSKYKPFFNYAWFTGAGTGDKVITVTSQNSSSQQGYTRRETLRKDSGNVSAVNLQAAADTYIAGNSVPKNTINVKLDPEVYPVGSINVGDIINLSIYKANTFLDFQGTARVSELTVQVDDNGKETIIPRLNFNN